MMSPTVSVIVPCYNVEALLPRCVDSIRRQSYRDLEIILVDDGSPDRCGEICDAYAAEDERVRVVHQPNRGLSEARNAGLDIMTGKLVTFVDSDDWILDECIETLVDLLVSHEADISVCNRLQTSNPGEPHSPGASTILELTQAQAIAQVNRPQYGSMVSACGKLYRAELFQELRFPPDRIHEDEFTTYKAILRSEKIVLTSAPLYVYWVRPGSITRSSFNPKAKQDAIDAFIERAQLLRAREMNDAAALTSGKALATYMQLVTHRPDCRPPSDDLMPDLRAVARRLLRESQPLKFRIFFAVALASPGMASWTYRRIARRPDARESGHEGGALQ